MKMLQDPSLLSELGNSYLFIDTNIFVAALNFEDYLTFLKNLTIENCALLSIPSVLFEFTRAAKTKDDFKKRSKFVTNLVDIYPIERVLGEMEDFIIVMQQCSSNTASYTDFLLCACLYKFRTSKVFLMTENHKDMPLSILERPHIITMDTERDIRNHGVYRFSQEKFDKAARKILDRNT